MAHPLLARAEATALRALLALPPSVQRVLAGRRMVRDGQVLDVETQWMLRLQRLVREPAVASLPVEQGRVAITRQATMVGGRQPIGEVRDLRVPGAEGEVGARLYVPTRFVRDVASSSRDGVPDESGLLVFFHGGGMIYGDLDAYDPVCRLLAERAGVRVLSVDYRLAPEHPCPAGLEDCWTAYTWVVEHAGELGADPGRIALGGDSAGGYLSAAVALRAAEAGLPCRFQLLVYPVTDMAGETTSRRMFCRDFYLTDEFIDLAQACYLDGMDPRDPRASVSFTPEIPDGLAPAYVVTAGFDPLRDEGEAWARRLADAGVPVELVRHPGLIHGFFYVVGVGRSQRAAVEEIADRLGRALAADDKPVEPR